jgi:hypothetical protein
MRRLSGVAEGRGARGLFIAGRSGSLAFGLILITAGIVLCLEQQNLLPPGFWRHGWPWIIVLFACIQIATARTANRLGDGVSFALIGLWLAAAESHWRGLSYANSWPLSLAAIGTGIVVHAIAALFLPERRHVVIHERQEEPSDV